MSKYATLMGARHPVSLPQSEPLDERQVQNNAGGYVFQLDCWKRLERFLILGSDSNTYYQSAKELTKQNANCVIECWMADPMRTLATIGLISTSGRAAKNDAAIFALALGATSAIPDIRTQAYAGVNKVCRTATHLFTFIKFVQALTGKSHFRRGLKNAVRSWYATKELDQCAFQMIKYREREGFSHERLMKACHPGLAVVNDETAARAALYRWARGLPPANEKQSLLLPNQVKAHLWALHPDKAPEDKRDLVALIKEYRLPWEAIRTEDLNKPDVWRAMLPTMGLTALIRELARMTQIGVLKDGEPELKIACERLTDQFELRKARIHPFNLLLAGVTYASGKSVRGSRTWTPVGRIKSALEEAFYMSFQYVQPSGKRHLVGLDISGSMSGPLMGGPLTCSQGSAALAMTIIRSEEEWSVMGFSTNFVDLGLHGKMSLEDVVKRVENRTFGGTDCSLPMLYALQQKQKVDVFTVITDNETWAGREHPIQALRKYRDKMKIDAKLIVVGMTATNFTIADPQDHGMLDIVGFDSVAPALMADFAR